MLRSANESIVKSFAKDCNLFYGMCAFDGMYYAGTQEQLKDIGCLDILIPD